MKELTEEKIIGCTLCGYVNKIASPDDIHIEISAKEVEEIDSVKMTIRCQRLDAKHDFVIYRIKPARVKHS